MNFVSLFKIVTVIVLRVLVCCNPLDLILCLLLFSRKNAYSDFQMYCFSQIMQPSNKITYLLVQLDSW